MGTSHTLFRRFFWADNILWKDDLQGHHCTLVLAGKDSIVDTKTIAAYVTGEEDWIHKAADWGENVSKVDGLGILWYGDLDHGQVFDQTGSRRKIVGLIRSFSAEE